MIVVLAEALMAACELYGEQQAAWYEKHPSLLSSHGIERDPKRLAHGRMCECAVCLALGENP